MSVSAAAAATTLSAITAVEPGTVPLLFTLPDGRVVQLTAAVDSTIDEIKSQVAASIGSDRPVELAFANSLLAGSSLLGDTNILDAYGHASGLLRVIEDGTLDPEQRVRALDSACAIVESLSNGVKDMEALCVAAMDSSRGTTIAGAAAAAAAQTAAAQRSHLLGAALHAPETQAAAVSSAPGAGDTRHPRGRASGGGGGGGGSDDDSIGSGEFNMLQDMLSQPASNPRVASPRDLGASYLPNPAAIRGAHPVLADRGIVLADDEGAPTPSSLARRLSEQLPDLFKSAAVEDLARCVGEHLPNDRNSTAPPATDGIVSGDAGQDAQASMLHRRNTFVFQPSISAIRAARRRMKNAANPDNIGNPHTDMEGSTVDHALEHALHTAEAEDAAVLTASKQHSATFAASARSTWLEDVMKTWEVGAVRSSGILESVEGGQDIAEYLNALDREVENDEERGRIDANDTALGDSEDSDEDEGWCEDSGDGDRNDPKDVELTDISGGSFADTGVVKSSSAVATAPNSSASSEQYAPLRVGGMPGQYPNNASPGHQGSGRYGLEEIGLPAHLVSGGVSPSSGAATSAAPVRSHDGHGRPLAPSPSTPVSPGQRYGTGSSSQASGLRLAPKIAPGIAPRPGSIYKPAIADNTNAGSLQNTAMGALGGLPPIPYKLPAKRRGRKRKNPELTEDERALMRKLQNRESAKLSRVRRKVIAAEYEDQITELVDNNDRLRDQVAALTNRLSYLQSILTVSVVPSAGSTLAPNEQHPRPAVSEPTSLQYNQPTGSGVRAALPVTHPAPGNLQMHPPSQHDQYLYNQQHAQSPTTSIAQHAQNPTNSIAQHARV
jgi:Basic region leucine zipper